MKNVPFPGLRSFQKEEYKYFYGRHAWTDSLLEKLSYSRFVAVVGESGCGKSSLVNAGLIPRVTKGFLEGAQSCNWEVVEVRPRHNPLEQLADAICHSLSQQHNQQDDDFCARVLEDLHYSNGIEKALKRYAVPTDKNILIVVDQFEEIFTLNDGDPESIELRDVFISRLLEPYQAEDQKQKEAEIHRIIEQEGVEGVEFDDLFEETPSNTEYKIYIVITMRTDNISDCSSVLDLPEAINSGLFLVPRMTIDELRMAIVKPLRAVGKNIDEATVSILLNSINPKKDHLPLLQHLLTRIWHAHEEAKQGNTITLEDYKKVGGFNNALQNHIVAIMAGLPGEIRQAALNVFRVISRREGQNNYTRSPLKKSEIIKLINISESAFDQAVHEFRKEGNTFLFPYIPSECDTSANVLEAVSKFAMEPDEKLDLTHESIIRQWTELRQRVDEDAESVQKFLRLIDDAEAWKSGRGTFLKDVALDAAVSWYQETKNEVQRNILCWRTAEILPKDISVNQQYDLVAEFIRRSVEDSENELEKAKAQITKERRSKFKLRLLSGALGGISFFLVAAIMFAWNRAEVAKQSEDMEFNQRNTHLAAQFIKEAQSYAQQGVVDDVKLMAVEAINRFGDQRPLKNYTPEFIESRQHICNILVPFMFKLGYADNIPKQGAAFYFCNLGTPSSDLSYESRLARINQRVCDTVRKNISFRRWKDITLNATPYKNVCKNHLDGVIAHVLVQLIDQSLNDRQQCKLVDDWVATLHLKHAGQGNEEVFANHISKEADNIEGLCNKIVQSHEQHANSADSRSDWQQFLATIDTEYGKEYASFTDGIRGLLETRFDYDHEIKKRFNRLEYTDFQQAIGELGNNAEQYTQYVVENRQAITAFINLFENLDKVLPQKVYAQNFIHENKSSYSELLNSLARFKMGGTGAELGVLNKLLKSTINSESKQALDTNSMQSIANSLSEIAYCEALSNSGNPELVDFVNNSTGLIGQWTKEVDSIKSNYFRLTLATALLGDHRAYQHLQVYEDWLKSRNKDANRAGVKTVAAASPSNQELQKLQELRERVTALAENNVKFTLREDIKSIYLQNCRRRFSDSTDVAGLKFNKPSLLLR